MLTKEALNEAMPLTLLMDEKDIGLVPIENTPLAELVRQTTVLEDQQDREAPIDLEATSIATESLELGVGGSQHDIVMDEIVKAGADCIRNQISVAKNVVRPKLMHYIECIEKDIVNLPASGLAKYEVKMYETPEVLGSAVFCEALERFKDTPYEPFDFSLRLPLINNEKILALLQTGDGEIDGLVARFYDRVGPEFMQSVFANVFTVTPNSDIFDREVIDLRTILTNTQTGNDAACILFLVGNRLIDNPPEGTANSLSDFNDKVALIRNQAGARLYTLGVELASARDNGKLIKKIGIDSTLIVYPEVYKEYVADGGDNETLFGVLLSDTPYYTLATISEHKESLDAIWQRNKRIEEKTAINNRFAYVKDSLKRNFSEIVSEEDLTEEEKSQAFNIFNEELALIRVDEFNDICAVCLRLLTRSLYFNTDIERILSSMEKISIENPTIDPREAALISSIELATDWVCSMIRPISTY